jgi:hypothetical protein
LHRDSKLDADSATTHPNGKDFLQAFLVGLSKPHESKGSRSFQVIKKRTYIYIYIIYGKFEDPRKSKLAAGIYNILQLLYIYGFDTLQTLTRKGTLKHKYTFS